MVGRQTSRTLNGVFFHLQEFGARGYQLIPGAAALSGKLVLWAPSAAIVNAEHAAGRLNFDSNDLLTWIQSGLVQVAARHEWLLSERSRLQGFWQNAPWTSGFDDQIRNIAIEDENNPDVRLRRVIGMRTGNGFAIAKEALERKSALIDRVGFHLSKGNISSSMIVAAKQDYKSYESLHNFKSEIEFLRYFFAAWVYNHVEAQNFVASDIALSSGNQALYIQDILRDEGSTLNAQPESPEFTTLHEFLKSDSLDEILEFMHFLLSIRGAKSLQKFGQRAIRADFLRQVILHPGTPPLLRLEAELSRSVSELSLDSYAPLGPITRGERNALKLIEDLWNGFKVLTGNISPAILRSKVLQTLNVKGVPKYKNHWAFLIAGRGNPRYKDLKKMRVLLNDFETRRKKI